MIYQRVGRDYPVTSQKFKYLPVSTEIHPTAFEKLSGEFLSDPTENKGSPDIFSVKTIVNLN